MTKRLIDNLSLKLISLLLAVIVWMVVLNIEDPVYTREITDIPVVEVNGDQITDVGKAYSYDGDSTVTVKVKGKTSILNKLTRDDFLAKADLSTLSITGAVNVDVSCPKYPNLEITSIGSSTVLKVTIENLIEKSLNVKVITKGETSSNRYIGTGVATPNMVTISGPESVVNNVTEAVVYVTVTSDYTKDITTNTQLNLLDDRGNSVTSSTLSVSEKNIDVTVPILETKTVPVELNVTGRVAEGYELVQAVYEPKEITIAGRSDALEQVDSIVLKDYDVTDYKESFEDSLNISQNLLVSLPKGVEFYDKEATLALSVTIEKIEDKVVEFPVSSISLTGTNSNFIYEKGSDGEGGRSISMYVSGVKSAIDELTNDNITAIVNVWDYDPGTYTLPVEVTFKDELVLLEDVWVQITITEKETNN